MNRKTTFLPVHDAEFHKDGKTILMYKRGIDEIYINPDNADMLLQIRRYDNMEWVSIIIDNWCPSVSSRLDIFIHYNRSLDCIDIAWELLFTPLDAIISKCNIITNDFAEYTFE